MSVMGFLGTETRDLFANRLRAFHRGLNETGYFEGRNVAVEYRWAEARNERLPTLAADLVRRQVTVIAANGPAAVAAKVATTTVLPVQQATKVEMIINLKTAKALASNVLLSLIGRADEVIN